MNKYIFLAVIFILLNVENNPQTYTTVADVDSFAYVTLTHPYPIINDSILVLKRDEENDLILINKVAFIKSYVLASAIINNYLVVASADSLVLYSIENKVVPQKLHQINVSYIKNIKKFGDYLLIYRNYESPLFKIEDDSLKLLTIFPVSLVPDINKFAVYYPRVFTSYFSDPLSYINIWKYSELEDSLLNVSTYTFGTLGSWHPEIVKMVTNTGFLSLIYEGYAGEDIYYWGTSVLSIEDTTLHIVGDIEDAIFQPAMPVMGQSYDNWEINDTYGAFIRGDYEEYKNVLYYADSYSPIDSISTNIHLAPSSPYRIRNSIYTIGNSFYYLYSQNGDYFTFNEFLYSTVPPSPPELISPLENQLVNYDSVNFSWGSSFASKYEINISTDSLFNDYLNIIIKDTFYNATNLEVDKKYYWRVKAKNGLGWSDYSTISSFITVITEIKEKETQNFQFSLSQNYPNPFNPTTTIKFTIPDKGSRSPLERGERGVLTSLIVYDILGRKVTTLVNEVKQPGVYEVEFDGSNLSSGIYYYQLKSGNFTETKKLVLIK